MLFRLIFTAWTVALSSAAPAQLLYAAPVLRYQQPVIQPIVAAPNPVFLYQGLPLGYQLRQAVNNTQISEIISIFQDAGTQAQGTIQQLQEWGQSWGQNWGQSWGQNRGEEDKNGQLPASTMELKPMLEERLDIQPNMVMLNPDMKTKMAPSGEQKQYYTVAGYPRFYYEYIQPAYSPILGLQTVSALRARSLADPNPIKNDKFLAQVAPIVAPVADALVPAATVPLVEPLKSFPVPEIPIVDLQPEQPAVPIVPVLAAEPGQAAISYAKFLQDNQVDPGVSSRSQPDEPNKSNDAVVVDSLKEGASNSIAKAAPVAAAVSGKAGHSEASPVATAIVGKDSLAIAQPIASAVAGEFGSYEQKKIEEKIVEETKDKVE